MEGGYYIPKEIDDYISKIRAFSNFEFEIKQVIDKFNFLNLESFINNGIKLENKVYIEINKNYSLKQILIRLFVDLKYFFRAKFFND